MLTFKEGFRSRINKVSLILQCKSDFPEPKIITMSSGVAPTCSEMAEERSLLTRPLKCPVFLSWSLYGKKDVICLPDQSIHKGKNCIHVCLSTYIHHTLPRSSLVAMPGESPTITCTASDGVVWCSHAHIRKTTSIRTRAPTVPLQVAGCTLNQTNLHQLSCRRLYCGFIDSKCLKHWGILILWLNSSVRLV